MNIMDKVSLECGVPNLVDVLVDVSSNVVFITLLRLPTISDMKKYRAWYVGMYDYFLNLRQRFSMVFDLRNLGKFPGLDIFVAKFALTQALEARTQFQVIASAVIVQAPSTLMNQAGLQMLRMFMEKGDSPAPRLLTSDLQEGLTFIAKHAYSAPALKFKLTAQQRAAAKESRRSVSQLENGNTIG